MTEPRSYAGVFQVPNLLCYEELITDKAGHARLAGVRRAHGLVRSATPRARRAIPSVLYSHRSTLIHSMMMASDRCWR